MWGALGLIAVPKKNKTLEDVANQYLHELLSRSFLQDFTNFGSVYRFTIHDLVHDLALFVAKDECLHVSSSIQNIPDNVRHLSFAESSLFTNLYNKKSVAVRTILFPNGTEETNGEALINTCVSNFKYLRVLDLWGSTIETLPHTIAKLKHLRYLDIGKNLNFKRLPESICKLQNLQVLRLEGCIELEALPIGLRKLISLRHLEFCTKQSILPENEIASLDLLAFLSIESSPNLESIFGDVKFPALKALNIGNCKSLKSFRLDGKKFPELEEISVNSCSNSDLELWKGNHLEEQNHKLKLKTVLFSNLSQLVTLPKWLQEFANSLQCLIIESCDNIETLPDWFRTMSNLKTLSIIPCTNLVSLPDNIHHLTALETLCIEGCHDLCEKYQPHVGEFWPKNITHKKHLH